MVKHFIKKYGFIFSLLIIGIGSFSLPSSALSDEVDELFEEAIKILLTSESKEERLAAISELEILSYEAALPALIRVLRNDSSAKVRKELARILRSYDKDSTRTALRQTATNDPDQDVRVIAFCSLIHLGVIADTDLLREVFGIKEKDEEGICKFFLDLLERKHPQKIREGAILALGEIGNISTFPVLFMTIKVEDPALHRVLWKAIFRLLERCEEVERNKIEEAIEKFVKEEIDGRLHVGYIEDIAPTALREEIFKKLLQEENEKAVEVNDKIIKESIESLVKFHIEKAKGDGRGWFYADQGFELEATKYGGIALGLLALLSTRKLSLDSQLAKKRDDTIRNAFSTLLSEYDSIIESPYNKNWVTLYSLTMAALLKREPINGIDIEVLNAWINKLITQLLASQSPKNGGWSYFTDDFIVLKGAETSFLTASILLALELSGVESEEIKQAKEKAIQFLYKLVIEADQVNYGHPEFAQRRVKNEKIEGPPSPRGSAGRSVVSQLALSFTEQQDQSKKMEFVRRAVFSSWQYLDDLRIHIDRDDTHEGNDQIAPYYFYYNLPYLASAMSLDSETEFGKQMRIKLLKKLFQMRLKSGLWPNEGPSIESEPQVYPQSMVLISLSALYRGEDASGKAWVLVPNR